MNDKVEFFLDGSEFIELKNLLKITGLCDTGGEAKNAIEQGNVLVDGILEIRKAYKVKAGQIVSYDNKKIKVIS